MGISVIIPENKWGYSLADREEGYRYPTLWLLCGGGFDYTDWVRYSAIELYAAQAGIAVVMPSAFYSGYMDTIHGDYKYWTQITKELPVFLRNLLPLSDARGGCISISGRLDIAAVCEAAEENRQLWP